MIGKIKYNTSISDILSKNVKLECQADVNFDFLEFAS